jgi:hypothetical protein
MKTHSNLATLVSRITCSASLLPWSCTNAQRNFAAGLLLMIAAGGGHAASLGFTSSWQYTSRGVATQQFTVYFTAGGGVGYLVGDIAIDKTQLDFVEIDVVASNADNTCAINNGRLRVSSFTRNILSSLASGPICKFKIRPWPSAVANFNYPVQFVDVRGHGGIPIVPLPLDATQTAFVWVSP